MDPSQLSSIDVIAASMEPVLGDLGRVSSPDGALTLMMGDIADAETLAARLGSERWERLLTDQRSLVQRIVLAHDGEVARHERDGFLATFPGAHAGLHAALDLQGTFAAPGGDGDGDGEGEGAAIRLGLHSGFVLGGPGQLMGRNVVLAARVAGEAGRGEILVSGAVKQYTEGDPRFAFEPRGERYFKGLHGEHELFCVRAA